MACLVHGQQRTEVCICALLEPVQFQSHHKLRLPRIALAAEATRQQMALVCRQGNGKVLRQRYLLLQCP